jgi:hypothetical protein
MQPAYLSSSFWRILQGNGLGITKETTEKAETFGPANSVTWLGVLVSEGEYWNV